jgi:hypothetical protein
LKGTKFEFEIAMDPMSINVNINVSNVEEFQKIKVIYCPQSMINFGTYLMLIMFLIVFIILPSIEIAFGIVYQNECSMNNFIPFYLVLAGFISIIILIFAIYGVKYFQRN